MEQEEILNKFREYVEDNIRKADPNGRLYLNPHLLDTESRVLELDENACCSIRIAALGHDIDRVFQDRIKKGDYPSYDLYKLAHAAQCAKKTIEVVGPFTTDSNWLADISNFIGYHDIKGGYPEHATPEQIKGVDLVRDGDSISFFHINIPIYFIDHPPSDFDKKIIFMYDKMSRVNQGLVKGILEFRRDEREDSREAFSKALDLISRFEKENKQA